MTDDMQSSFGIVDDGSTDKTIQKVQQFDKALGQAEDSVGGLSKSLLAMDRVAEKSLNKANKAAAGGRGGGGRSSGVGRGLGQLGRGVGGDLGGTISQVGQLGQQAEMLGGSASKATMLLGGAGIALAAAGIAVKLFQSHLDEANEEFTRSLGVLESIARITAKGSDAAADRIRVAEAEIAIQQQLQAESEATSQKFAESSVFKFDPFDIVNDLGEVADEAAKAASDTIKSEQAIIDSLTDKFGPALKINTAEVEKSAAALQRLAEQESNLRAKRTQALDDLAVDRARRDSRAAEDEAEADTERADQRAEAARKDIANVDKIRKAGAAQQTKTLKAAMDSATKIINDSNQARIELQQEFSDKAIEDQNSFNERRTQAENDFRNAEFDAIQDNDIIKALRAQRDFDDQQKQDKIAFDKEAQLRETEKQKRLQELRDEQTQRIAEVRANLVIEIAAQKQALRERLRDNALAASERKRQEDKSEKAAIKARAKSRRRQIEDDALADERSARAFQEQLKAIEAKKQAEQQALAAVFKTLQASGQATVRVVGEATTIVINSMGQVVQQFVNGMANAANRSGGIRAFAEGGIVTRPTLGLIGEKGPEAVIPLGSGGAQGFGGQPIIINLTTADIATGQQVGQAIRGAQRQMAQVDIQVLADSLAGVTQ